VAHVHRLAQQAPLSELSHFHSPTLPCWRPAILLPQESLYAEAASWADPADLEGQLARAAERRKRALTGEELRQVKQRRQEMKDKKRTAWLFT
jgi:hypothetical protein